MSVFVYDRRLKKYPPGKFFGGKDHGSDIVRQNLDLQGIIVKEESEEIRTIRAVGVKIIIDPYDHEYQSYYFIKGLFVPRCFRTMIENEDVQMVDYDTDLSNIKLNSQGKILCYGVWIDLDIHRKEIIQNFGWRNGSEDGIDFGFSEFTSFFHLNIQNNTREVGVIFKCDQYLVCDQKKDAIDKYQEKYISWLGRKNEILGMLIEGDHSIGENRFDLVLKVDTFAETSMFYTDLCITGSRDKFDNGK